MGKIKIILFSIIVLTALMYANPLSTYKDHLGLSGAEKDTLYVVNPIVYCSIQTDTTKKIYIDNVFNTNDYYYIGEMDGFNDSLVSAELDELNGNIFISLQTYENHGYTDASYYVSLDSTGANSISDTFIISVENPAYDWFEWGGLYSFQPEYTVGVSNDQWKAATHFSLGTDSLFLKKIEFGFALEEMIDWQLVKFNEVPTDTIINNLADSVFCYGKAPFPIEETYIDSSFANTYFSGDVALVFSSEGNYMSMDPNGESSRTWVWTEGDGWVLPSSYSSAYDGAWYMRMQVFNLTTSSIETYYSGTISNFELEQNYPNPFNPTTEINFTLNHNSLTKLKVFNSSGEVVKTLNDSKLAKGHHSFSFDGQDLNSGVYFYQLEADGVRSTKKMILMK
ncbi:MAG: T9SS type A sorting domain-containing protein [Candidatus Delongbacteria bacterium]|nr:T9SS type A sorting domain-containing protein [Candidatus Delongbacteria bacterium]